MDQSGGAHQHRALGRWRHHRDRRHPGRRLRRHHHRLQRPSHGQEPPAGREGEGGHPPKCVIYQPSRDQCRARGSSVAGYRKRHRHRRGARDLFKVPKVAPSPAAGVVEGEIHRDDGEVRIVRDGTVIFEGHMASLRRFKDDVKSVKQGLLRQHRDREVLRPEGGRDTIEGLPGERGRAHGITSIVRRREAPHPLRSRPMVLAWRNSPLDCSVRCATCARGHGPSSTPTVTVLPAFMTGAWLLVSTLY